MIGLLPGSTIEVELSRRGIAEDLLAPMFLAGGLVLSQVAEITGLAPHTIHNWVKRGFVSPPRGKRYARDQLSRLLIINALKDSLQIESIIALCAHAGAYMGADGMSDTALYCRFTDALGALGAGIPARGAMRTAVEASLADYAEPYAGAKARLLNVLEIMLLAYSSGVLHQNAQRLLKTLDL